MSDSSVTTPFLLFGQDGSLKRFATQDEALRYARARFFETFDVEDTRTGRVVYQEAPRFQWV